MSQIKEKPPITVKPVFEHAPVKLAPKAASIYQAFRSVASSRKAG